MDKTSVVYTKLYEKDGFLKSFSHSFYIFYNFPVNKKQGTLNYIDQYGFTNIKWIHLVNNQRK